MIFGNTLVATFNDKGGSYKKERPAASARSTRVPGASKVAVRSRAEPAPVLREAIVTEEAIEAAEVAAAARPDTASPGRHKADEHALHFESPEAAAGDPWSDGFESGSDSPFWFGACPAAGSYSPSACSRLASRLERGLASAKAHPLRCDTILAPERLLERAARLVVRAAEREPCGLAGAVVHVMLLPPLDAPLPPCSSPSLSSRSTSAGTRGGGGGAASAPALRLARLELDPGRAPTFEVSVLLRREPAWRWSDALLRLPRPLGPCLRRLAAARGSPQRTVRLSGGFEVVKRKLYRHPEEPCAVEEDEEEEDVARTPVIGRRAL